MNTKGLKLKKKLEKTGYFPTEDILYGLQAACDPDIGLPLLVSGSPGVGKTSLALALAEALKMPLIRLTLYSGIHAEDMLYDYDYTRQLLSLNAIQKNINKSIKDLSVQDSLKKIIHEVDFFDENFILERPILRSITAQKRCVLLIDEVDKADAETENILLEFLDSYSITIPQYGTIKAQKGKRPIVIITSNNYRELSDTFKRRCAYLYIEKQDREQLSRIFESRLHIEENPKFIEQLTDYYIQIRDIEPELRQTPSVAEAISWGNFLLNCFGAEEQDLEPAQMLPTLCMLLKNESDQKQVKDYLKSLSEKS